MLLLYQAIGCRLFADWSVFFWYLLTSLFGLIIHQFSWYIHCTITILAGVRGKGDFAVGAIPTAEEQKTCGNNEYSKLG